MDFIEESDDLTDLRLMGYTKFSFVMNCFHDFLEFLIFVFYCKNNIDYECQIDEDNADHRNNIEINHNVGIVIIVVMEDN